MPSFFANDAYANVGRLDHRNVVATVADAADALFGEGSNQFGYISLLGWRTTARHYGRQVDGNRNEVMAVVSEHQSERFAVDQKTGIRLSAEEIKRVVGEVFAFDWLCVSSNISTAEYKPTLRNCVHVLASGNEL